MTYRIEQTSTTGTTVIEDGFATISDALERCETLDPDSALGYHAERTPETCTTCGQPADKPYTNEAAGERCADAIHATIIVPRRRDEYNGAAAPDAETGWVITGPTGGLMGGAYGSYATAVKIRDRHAPEATIELAKISPAKIRDGYIRIPGKPEPDDEPEHPYEIKVGLTGDTAEADTAEDALAAAAQLVRDAHDGIPIQGRIRAARDTILIAHNGRYDGPLTEIARHGITRLDALAEGRS